MRSLFSILTLCMVLLTAGACGGGGGGSTGPTNSGGSTGGGNNPPPGGGSTGGTTASVKVGNDFFNPATSTVARGTVVTWTWDTCSDSNIYGQTCVAHNVTFDDGGGTSQVQSTGSFSRTFNTAGTYDYHCSVHGAAMAGKVVVQ